VDDLRDILDAYRDIFRPKTLGPAQDDSMSAFLAAGTGPEHNVLERVDVDFVLDCFEQGLPAVNAVESAHAEGRPYDVAFVDMRMPPGIDGLETLRRMWMVDPDLQIVICSAYHDHPISDIRAHAQALNGSFLIVRKPFDPEEILQAAYTLSERGLKQRQSKSIYTILPGPELRIERISPTRISESAMMFAEWVTLPDGSKRKLLKFGHDTIPDAPQIALEQFIAHAPVVIAELRAQIAEEESRMDQAKKLLSDLHSGTVSAGDMDLAMIMPPGK
jgi:CheY-like chemotaxis protein